jgi:hypothetical protein
LTSRFQSSSLTNKILVTRCLGQGVWKARYSSALARHGEAFHAEAEKGDRHAVDLIRSGGCQHVEVTIVGGPTASSQNTERTSVMGGRRFSIRNEPSPANLATNTVVPHALLSAMAHEASAAPWRFR